ncbi:MAG TPA: biopolymer transporter ExbD [Pirellulaceae bacterium]|nr:biopolymer transporter ExbD [Pirellulaceae bacterium]
MAVNIKKGGSAAIDFTPMIDMVFNLLIFFMVTTEFAKEDRELTVKLPSASEARPLTAQPQDVFININDKGEFYVNRKFMAIDDVEAYLRQKVTDNPANLSVKINADGRVSFQPVVAAMNVCNKAGVRDYSVVTQGEGN